MFKCLWEIPGEFHKYQYLPVTHCAQQGDMEYLYRRMFRGVVRKIVPQVWGLVPLGHVNSPTGVQVKGLCKWGSRHLEEGLDI